MPTKRQTEMGKTTADKRAKKYAKVSDRLNAILIRLHNGEVLSKAGLAQEFGTDKRTIQRDVNERLRSMPIVHKGDHFFLEKAQTRRRLLDKQGHAILDLIEELLKEQSATLHAKALPLLEKIRRFDASTPFHTHLNMEKIDHKLNELVALHEAIQQKRVTHCRYKMGEKTYDIDIKPLKIATFEGFWYVIAMDARNDIVKKYLLRNISHVQTDNETFETDQSLDKQLAKASTIWFEADERPFEVRLYIEGAVAHYFKTRPIHPTQTIEGEDHDGGIEVVVKITHAMEIVPFVKQWLPHVRVMAPQWIDETIREDCRRYLDENR